MTAFYIREVHSKSVCQLCKRHAANERSFCPTHLRKAREQFAAWSSARRAAGKCIRCDEPGYEGQLRCKVHRAKLATYCHEWHMRNKDRVADYDKKRREDWIAKGKCPTCPQHRKLTGGLRRCWTCRRRHRTYRSREVSA